MNCASPRRVKLLKNRPFIYEIGFGCKRRDSRSFDGAIDEQVTGDDELESVIAEPTRADADGLLLLFRILFDLFVRNEIDDGTDADVSCVFVWTMKSFVNDNDVDTNDVGVENELDESEGKTDKIVLLLESISQPLSVLNWLKCPKRRAS